ncbi:hypothetical protein P8452_58715 [Trifolium repens]|nr:hypothetical protein P8452_58715 [Trifolium repens]
MVDLMVASMTMIVQIICVTLLKLGCVFLINVTAVNNSCNIRSNTGRTILNPNKCFALGRFEELQFLYIIIKEI